MITPKCGECGRLMKRKNACINGVYQSILTCHNHNIPIFEIMKPVAEEDEEGWEEDPELYDEGIGASFEVLAEDLTQDFELLADPDNN